MSLQRLFFKLFISICVLLSSCSAPEPIIKTIEITRIVEVDRIVTATLLPTPGPSPTSRMSEQREKRQEIVQSFHDGLSKLVAVEEVYHVQLTTGVFDIEAKALGPGQPGAQAAAWSIIEVLAEIFVQETNRGQRIYITGVDNFSIVLTTYSYIGGVHEFRSETDFETMEKISNGTILFEEWVSLQE